MKNRNIGQTKMPNNYNHNLNQLNTPQYGFKNPNGLSLAPASAAPLAKVQPNASAAPQTQFYQQ